MKKLVLYLQLILLLISYQNIYAQKNVNFEKLDSSILKAINDFGATGVAVAIVKDGEIVFKKGYGYQNFSKKDTVTTESLFAIASLSKAFTTASIAMLVEEGKLDWNDRVVDRLTGFQLSHPYVTKELRIVDLLTHRAGFNTFDGDLLWYGTNYTRKEILKRFRNMPVKKSFRISYGYSNVMFITAGEVIEETAGLSWDEFVKKNIFTPLGMKTSTTTNKGFDKKTNVAIPHINRIPLDFINYDNCGPAASINSNVEDLSNWMKMWLNKGVFNNDTLFSEKTWKRILRSETALNGGDADEIYGKHFSNAAMGWFLSDYAGRKIIQHGGGLPGYLSRITVVPEDNLGIIVLTNDESGLMVPITNEIIDMYLSENPKDNFTKFMEMKKKRETRKDKQSAERRSSRVNGTSPSLTLEKYAGTFEDQIYGKANITIENDQLKIVLEPAAKMFTSKMSHWHYDTFNIKFNDPFLPEGLVTFQISNKGKIESFKIDLPNPDFHFYNFTFNKID